MQIKKQHMKGKTVKHPENNGWHEDTDQVKKWVIKNILKFRKAERRKKAMNTS